MSVYFIYNPKTRLVKIGESENVSSRIKNLELQGGIRLVLLAVVPNSDRTRESNLHEKFRRYRVLGEWFVLARPIRKFLEIPVGFKGRDSDDFKNSMLGRTHTLEARLKMSKAKLGTLKTEAHKRHISEACRGLKHPEMQGRAPWNKGLKAAKSGDPV